MPATLGIIAPCDVAEFVIVPAAAPGAQSPLENPCGGYHVI